jgi:hypothetical protein
LRNFQAHGFDERSRVGRLEAQRDASDCQLGDQESLETRAPDTAVNLLAYVDVQRERGQPSIVDGRQSQVGARLVEQFNDASDFVAVDAKRHGSAYVVELVIQVYRDQLNIVVGQPLQLSIEAIAPELDQGQLFLLATDHEGQHLGAQRPADSGHNVIEV